MSDTQAIRLVDHLDDVDDVDDVIPELQSTDSDDESDGEADSDNEPDGKEVVVIDDDDNVDSQEVIVIHDDDKVDRNKRKQACLRRFFPKADVLTRPISNWGAPLAKIDEKRDRLKFLKDREEEEQRQKAASDQQLLEEIIGVTTRACASTFKTAAEENRQEVKAIEARINFMEMETTRAVKVWNARPSNWKHIAQHYLDYGEDETFRVYGSSFGATSIRGKQTAIKRWVADMNIGAAPKQVHRNSILGADFDELLFKEFQKRRAQGFSVHFDDVILLIPVVAARNAIDLTPYIKPGGGGTHCFQKSWVQRWAKRMNIGRRCASSKHRLPIDEATLAVKDEKYITTGAYLILKHDIKYGAAGNIDETFGNFCAQDKTTLEEKGCKKVTILKGKEKEGATVTLCCAENGFVMKHVQTIFKGKTARTLNNCVIPQWMLADYTESGWQDNSSYIRYLKDRFLPFKNHVLTSLGLDPNVEWFLLIHDCHWSHLHDDVIKFLKENRVACLYVQPGCTDLRQVLDVSVNRVFKLFMAKEYQVWMVEDFERSGANFESWQPDTSIANLKKIIHRFIKRGLDAISTPEMEEAVRRTFKNQARLDMMRSPEMQEKARQMIADESAAGEEAPVQFNLEEMEPDELEEPDDMNGELEVEEVGQQVAAAVEDVVTHPAYKKIKFILKEPTDFSA